MRPSGGSPFTLALAGISLLTSVAATSYDMIKDFSGPSFFDDWTFYNNYDNLTNGDAIQVVTQPYSSFVSASVAASSQLAYVDSTTNNAIIKVDNTSTVVWNDKRNTVRITTNDRYGLGSVWVADMYHMPYGCSVWPAWWSQAPDWPTGGEIDTLEGVNLMTVNQMGLHTEPGCTSVNPNQLTTSTQGSTDCSYLSNNNSGCIVTDTNAASYGAGFAAAGGGVYVTEFAESGISVWFFDRTNVPSALSSNASTIDTSTFGTPSGNWPSTGCTMDQFFEAQNLILDITLCGDFAGNPTVFNETCSGICYNDYVVGNGSNYATAYFELASIRVYSSNGTNNAISGSGSTTSSTNTTTSSTGSSGNGATMAAHNLLALMLALTFGGVALLFA
ncbi:hypothetical protein H0H92_011279 [Tricholoma furcatifolium]|nr:hypothetical protein H0H92_011279 [Tricholoma furcatifolium]